MISGTRYLLKEHKKCISELEHLKGLLSELHRYVDLIVERGVALRGAFEDLRSGHYLNFSVSFFVKKNIDLPSSRWGNTILFRSSQQLHCLCLGALKGFLS